MDLWLARLVLIHLHLHQLHPLFYNYTPELRVSVFLYPCCFSLAGCLLLFLIQAKRCILAPLFFSKSVVRVALLFGPLAPHPAASVAAHLSSSRTVPWPLVLRLLASSVLCTTRPASPTWSSREPSDLSELVQGDPLGLLEDVLWALSRIP
jgi:hypothetical protein